MSRFKGSIRTGTTPEGRAARAIAEAGVLPVDVADHLEYGDLIGAGTVPSPHAGLVTVRRAPGRPGTVHD